MLYRLRNGIMVEKTNNAIRGFVRVVSIPDAYRGDWEVGRVNCLLAFHDDPLKWEGGAHGKAYDVVSDVEC